MVWFRQECPNGTIDTEEILVDLDREVEAEVPTGNWILNPNRPGKKIPEKMTRHDKGYARFRAVVTDGKGGHATASKSENAASFPDYIEKAETGAVGCALAMLGYGTQFTGDELNLELRISTRRASSLEQLMFLEKLENICSDSKWYAGLWSSMYSSSL